MKFDIRNTLVLFATLLIAFFLQSTILVSPSHPFVDNDGDGIDDFEEGIGEYADPAVRAKIYGVNFPITELGNCGSYAACRSYCEDPVNANACIGYGRSKGFYKDEPDEKVKTVLSQARTTLGCDSQAACQNFCEVPANHDRCASFAQGQGIAGGYVDDPAKATVLAKAKEVLGCSSPDACKAYCEQEANRDKCGQFAQQVGLHGGEHQVGPGGCTSEATCKSFCSDPNNFQVCSGFSSTSGGTFTGPGGCSSEESCRTYCQQNPQACGYIAGGPGASPPPGYNPQEMCNKTPNCSWAGNTCQCGFYGETEESAKKASEYASFCQTNPDKCKPGQPGSFDTSGKRQEFEDYCKTNPDKCQPTSGGGAGPTGGFDPATECARYGCTWSNNSCQCTSKDIPQYPTPGGTYSYPSPTGTYSYPSPTGGYSYPSPTGTYSYPSPSYYTPSGYSYPSPSYPTPPSYSYPSPSYSTPPPYGTPEYSTPPPYGTPTYETPPPYGTPSYSYPSPSGTQGVSTQRGLLEIFWQFLQGR